MVLLKTLYHYWYPDSLAVFLRLLRNILLVIEEDLAVGLMLKLLFVPLFHDSSLVGRGISFFFRLSRIFIGVFAFLAASVLIFFLALFWFITPIAMFISLISQFIPLPFFGYSLKVLSDLAPILFLGVALFIHHYWEKPPEKLWHIKNFKDIWRVTKLRPKDITWQNLVKSLEVQEFLKSLELSETDLPQPQITLDDSLLEKTYSLATKVEAKFITATHFFVAAISRIPNIESELLKLNLKLTDFEGSLSYMEEKRNKWRKIYIWDEEFAVKHLKGVNRGWLGAPTPALDSISEDITRQASRAGFPDFIGRQAVVSEVITVLSQEKDRNVLLVGEAGSGRTALVNYLAKLIVSGDAPDSLATKRLVKLELPKLMSQVSSEGDLAKKVKEAFDEVESIENIIIYVDQIHELGLGDAGKDFNLYSLMLPYLESSSFQFIGSTEAENYTKVLEKNSSLARLFHKIEVPPASVDETVKVILEKGVELARFKGINISYPAIKFLVEQSNKLIHDRVLPDSALSVLEECQVVAADGFIKKETVGAVLQKRVSVPIVELDKKQKDFLLNLEEIIHQELIDQEEAVKKVSDTLRRASASLREQSRPIGSFLFVGPTGVGKTELAKILSEKYFKTNGAFLRFDMSEYQSADSVATLIGNSDNPGDLTQTVKNKPYALVLLDEFEKANPSILTLFLQVLEDGRLTDSSGKTTDFTSTIIIATSNVGSIKIIEGLKQNLTFEAIESQVREELLKVYKPELINRFDAVVMFKPLKPEELTKIVEIKLLDLKKMLKDQGYIVEFTPELVAELAKKGFDPALGARPLRRLIQDTLEAKLSKMILADKLPKGETFRADISLLS